MSLEDKMKELTAEYYFDLSKFKHKALFDDAKYVWDALKKLTEYIKNNLKPETKGNIDPRAVVGEEVYIGEGTIVEPYAIIEGPAIIGDNCKIRSGAYLRENVIIGDNCVVRSEIKSSVIMDNSNAAHLSYLGDSIIGQNCNLGAGTILSNLKLDEKSIKISVKGEPIDTGLKKLGIIMGDNTHTGCNVVTNPGTLTGPNNSIYSNAVLRGFYSKDQVVKLKQNIELAPRTDLKS